MGSSTNCWRSWAAEATPRRPRSLTPARRPVRSAEAALLVAAGGANLGAVTVVREIPNLVVVEREHSLPLDHAAPDGSRITVFSRELADPSGRERPLLVFF